MKTKNGWIHQTSARIVSPNERRGVATSAGFIVRPLLQWRSPLFSTLPNYQEHSKALQILPVLEYSWRCSPDNRSRNRPRSVSHDRVRRSAFIQLVHSHLANLGIRKTGSVPRLHSADEVAGKLEITGANK